MSSGLVNHLGRPCRSIILLMMLLVLFCAKAEAVANGTDASRAHVAIRFGKHDDYDRLVLEFPGAIRPHLNVNAGAAIVTFDVPANVDTARLDQLLPKSMLPVTLHADGKALSFHVPPGGAVHDHSTGKMVILDILHPGGGALASDQAAAAGVSAQPETSPAAADRSRCDKVGRSWARRFWAHRSWARRSWAHPSCGDRPLGE